MNKILFLLPLIIGLLSACSDDVPTVDDPHNIVINGEKMKQTDFIKKYWANCPSIANPKLEVTFVGWNFTIHGTMAHLCDWVNNNLLPGEKSA